MPAAGGARLNHCAPLLGLEHAKAVRPVERLVFLADHLLYGTVLAGGRRCALPPRILSTPGR